MRENGCLLVPHIFLLNLSFDFGAIFRIDSFASTRRVPRKYIYVLDTCTRMRAHGLACARMRIHLITPSQGRLRGRAQEHWLLIPLNAEFVCLGR